jgi:AraC-like DNA-binding protein/ligand-binding sensor protein
MDANQKLVATLAHSALFQRFVRAFNETTGLPLTLRPVETWQLPFHGKVRENAFCALIAAKSSTCCACLRLQEQLSRDAMTQPATRTCAYGLCETAVPVKLGAQTIGFLQTGQVFRQSPTNAAFQRAVIQARRLGLDLRSPAARQAWFATPVASLKKLDSVTELLAIFAEHLAAQGNQLAMHTAHAEPPIITRARLFIQEHYREELSLLVVSRSVNTSLFYFCKQFRKATGLSFTEFVTRTRIEKAKNLLLNPNLRVSEIAYDIGFHSLTHFNRAFKKILGQSPTEYRDALPATP